MEAAAPDGSDSAICAAPPHDHSIYGEIKFFNFTNVAPACRVAQARNGPPDSRPAGGREDGDG